MQLANFINAEQLACINDLIANSDEAIFYVDLLNQVVAKAQAIPALYAQDGNTDPVAHMHYFNSYSDFYICEIEGDRAFGQVDLGNGPELGYISMSEMLQNKLELDLYFDPTPLSICNQ